MRGSMGGPAAPLPSSDWAEDAEGMAWCSEGLLGAPTPGASSAPGRSCVRICTVVSGGGGGGCGVAGPACAAGAGVASNGGVLTRPGLALAADFIGDGARAGGAGGVTAVGDGGGGVGAVAGGAAEPELVCAGGELLRAAGAAGAACASAAGELPATRA